jgi:guanidinopropionase
MLSMTEMDAEKAVSTFFWWRGVPTFLACPTASDLEGVDIGIAGVGYSGGNVIDRMQYLAPRAVRSRSMAYHRIHRRFMVDPFALCRICDAGDAPIASLGVPEQANVEIQSFFEGFDRAETIPVAVGGDHSITLPILRAIAGARSRHGGPVGLIHLDAHTDCVPLPMGGSILHAAAWPAALVEEGLVDAKRTIQIGIRGQMATWAQDDFARDLGFRLLGTDEFIDMGVEAVVEETRRVVGDGPVYITWDMDALDPIYAPAVTDPEADGLSIRDAIALLNGLRGLDIIGADLVEFGPPMDTPGLGITVFHATHILHELVTLIADSLAARGLGHRDDAEAAPLAGD